VTSRAAARSAASAGAGAGGRADVRTEDVTAALHRAGVRDVDTSDLARALYASDASVYRVPPLAVVRPQHTDELAAVLAAVRETGVPLTMRGAGTSIAGNAVGPGVVVDTLRHLHRVVSLDPEAATAVVEPGAVHATLQRAASAHGLRFGPDPSSHTRCTVGGMVGNNACGSRALGYGRTSDNVVALHALTASGEPASGSAGALASLVDSHLGEIRPRFGRFTRQVSGYALEHLLPENGRSLDRFLVGSEGTLAVVTAATVRLVRDPPHRVLAVLGYPSMADAADDVPALLAAHPVACEGMDQRISSLVPTRPELPRGAGWLLVEVTADTQAEAVARARAVAQVASALDHRVVADAAEQRALWRIREDGAGLASRATPRPGQAGWEDAAVPPERLGGYLRAFDALLHDHGYTGVPYGHFGDGCVHVRVDFDLESPGGRGRYRDFVHQAARLAAAYGGSLSGEHGDGRARSELLPLMYDDVALRLFAAVKAIFDPDDLLNPGVLVRPARLDADVRLAGLPAPSRRPLATVRLPRERGDLTAAVHRCTGVGKCVADDSGGVMCPSYQATREEKDSTRGRARGTPRRSSRRSTCAWPAKAAPGTAPRGWTWRRTRQSGCTASTPDGAARSRTTRSAGCPRWSPSCRRPWPTRASGSCPRSPSGWPGSTRGARCRRRRRARSARVRRRSRRTRTWRCGSTRSPTASAPRWPTLPSRSSRRPARSCSRWRPPTSAAA
jgi:FAD/FMN-containing dehydrogenase